MCKEKAQQDWRRGALLLARAQHTCCRLPTCLKRSQYFSLSQSSTQENQRNYRLSHIGFRSSLSCVSLGFPSE